MCWLIRDPNAGCASLVPDLLETSSATESPLYCECRALVERIRDAVAGHLLVVEELQEAPIKTDLNRRSRLEMVARLSQ